VKEYIYIVLRGHWCNIIVLNAHAPSEEKSDDTKDSFYEELEQFFLLFCKVPHENSVRRFQCISGEREYFQPTIGNERLHKDSNDNGVGIVKFATSKKSSKEHDVSAPNHS
jgi:hypothetical protein